jgi:hypothetical protein
MTRQPPALRASGTAMTRRHIPVPAGHARDPSRPLRALGPRLAMLGCAIRDLKTARRVRRAPIPARSAGRKSRHPGCPFFWSLFFGQAKKSDLPWVSHPQVAFERGRSSLDKIFTPHPCPLPQGERDLILQSRLLQLLRNLQPLRTLARIHKLFRRQHANHPAVSGFTGLGRQGE